MREKTKLEKIIDFFFMFSALGIVVLYSLSISDVSFPKWIAIVFAVIFFITVLWR